MQENDQPDSRRADRAAKTAALPMSRASRRLAFQPESIARAIASRRAVEHLGGQHDRHANQQHTPFDPLDAKARCRIKPPQPRRRRGRRNCFARGRPASRRERRRRISSPKSAAKDCHRSWQCVASGAIRSATRWLGSLRLRPTLQISLSPTAKPQAVFHHVAAIEALAKSTYELPIKIPAINTSTPPTTTWKTLT